MKPHFANLHPHEIRAAQAGRLTQIWRPIKPQPGKGLDETHGGRRSFDAYCPEHPETGHEMDYGFMDGNERTWKCHLGQPGDRISGRETWSGKEWAGRDVRVRYSADNFLMKIDASTIPSGYVLPLACRRGDGWVSPIMMPAWASRFTFLNLGVRVALVQDASEEDAAGMGFIHDSVVCIRNGRPTLIPKLHDAWTSLHGPTAWERNDWCWAVKVKVVASV